MGHALPTHFAPAELATPDELSRQRRALAELPFLRAVLDAVPGPLAVLNAQRQVVLANRALAELLGLEDPSRGLGLRPGQLLGCVRAGEADCGCGATQFCRACGAARAVVASQGGVAETSECRVLRQDAAALDLRVSAVPLRVGGEGFTVFSLADIGHEKRRHALERVFFHDVLNTAGNLKTLAQVLEGAGAEEVLRYRPLLARIADELLTQIREQKDLAAAEADDLAVTPGPLDASRLVAEVADLYRARRGGAVPIRAQDGHGAVPLVSDESLLKRVLGNMVKNALEASGAGDTVTVGCAPEDGGVRFWVHNPGAMAPDVQLQIFQRSFSTKGPGRGLGTYSMRLLAERYLGGRVSFRSSPEEGTVFEVWCPAQLTSGS